MRHLPKCRRCSQRYEPGHYGEHSRSLAHQRELRTDAKVRREKARQAAAWEAERNTK